MIQTVDQAIKLIMVRGVRIMRLAIARAASITFFFPTITITLYLREICIFDYKLKVLRCYRRPRDSVSKFLTFHRDNDVLTH